MGAKMRTVFANFDANGSPVVPLPMPEVHGRRPTDTYNFDANGSPVMNEEQCLPASVEVMIRASGDTPCSLCGRPYKRHPLVRDFESNGECYLHAHCDGTLLKL